MRNKEIEAFAKQILEYMPNDWLKLTTHRLDIYDESQAKTQFLSELNKLYQNHTVTVDLLGSLPTAYDYIRLGHPLSCVLEWIIAKAHGLQAAQVISFSSVTIPILAVLRSNALAGKKTLIAYSGKLPEAFDSDVIQKVYGYSFDLLEVNDLSDLPTYEGTIIYCSKPDELMHVERSERIDIIVNYAPGIGSILVLNENASQIISEIQHVRRRETIAMTPANCLLVLKSFIQGMHVKHNTAKLSAHKASVFQSIQDITGSKAQPIVASSGLSMQYAIVMGLIHHALETAPDKKIKILVPTNCYGGTNDQARRVAAVLENVEIVDLNVDGDNNMVDSLNELLNEVARLDAIPFIIAEIPTNPRVQVPDLDALKESLVKARKTADGTTAMAPIFILDQTFCPNTSFLRQDDTLSAVQAISYVSGSKFPSGGKCTAGYCVANENAAQLLGLIRLHQGICDNEATALQYQILAEQLPSMNQRIHDAYLNTRDFVTFIQETLPQAKINFVSEELAAQNFTPSVFSLDLPSKGDTPEAREAHKRELNLKLINRMITQIPEESKYCVSYGQLQGCYWTVPATSTQGTTKEGDKDYIARVAVSPDLDLDRHKDVFKKFVEDCI